MVGAAGRLLCMPRSGHARRRHHAARRRLPIISLRSATAATAAAPTRQPVTGPLRHPAQRDAAGVQLYGNGGTTEIGL